MTSSVITTDIDHVGVAGRHMDALLPAYERLGFRLTKPEPLMGVDRDGNTVPLGQVSAHFMFRDSYVELSAVTGENPANHLEPWLARYEGLHILALATADATRTRAALVDDGLNPGPVQGAGREIHYGQGGSARFAWFGFPPGAFPEAFVCMVEQRTPEIVFQPEMTAHPNGALDLCGVYMVARDVGAARRRFQSFKEQGTHRFIDVMSPEVAGERFPGVAVPAGGDCLLGMKIRVRAIADLKRCLDQSSVPCFEGDNGICVTPEHAGGAMIVFSE